MKNKGKIWSVFSIIAALIIGFFIGIAVNYPTIDTSNVSGTIAKINKYRNAQSSISDVDLKNTLTSDSTQLKGVQNYLKYFYASTVKMSSNIQFALKEANALPNFKAANQPNLTELTKYNQYLSSARTDLLLALSSYQEPDKIDAILLLDMFNQVNNVIAQMTYRNNVVLEFIGSLASYAEENNVGNIEGLKTAHDLLALNEIEMAVMTSNKILLKALDNTMILSNTTLKKLGDRENMKAIFQQDSERLGRLMDNEKLGFWDSEKLGFFDTEKLGIFDSENLGCWDAEKLGNLLNDSENLGFWDSEKLGLFFDSEKLGYVKDAEQLGLIPF